MESIQSYVPSVYTNFTEMDELVQAEDSSLTNAYSELTNLVNNQFVVTADDEGLHQYETLFDIVSTPSETVEFRRQRLINRFSMMPPFSYRFFEGKLNEIIGAGKWSMTVNNATRTLTIESSASDQAWFTEVLITVGRLKPANMVFINKPLVQGTASATEQVSYSSINNNYVLGISWTLGQKPFQSLIDKGVIKMAGVASMQAKFLNDLATFAASDISNVLINDTVLISTFVTKSASSGTATIEYNVLASQVSQVNTIALRDSSNNVLTSCSVYVPMAGDAVFKHTILVKEV